LYKIFLRHEGYAFVSNVPEPSACSSNGATYAEALERVQEAIADLIGEAQKAGVLPPPLLKKPAVLIQILNSSTDKSLVLDSTPRNVNSVRALLIKKFGPRSNRELAACIGIFGKDAPIMLSGAASGSGTRKVRCAIALALDKAPSQLWPGVSSRIRQGDDIEYKFLKQSNTKL